MKLVVVSHKPCWVSDESPSGYATDGGFPMQMMAISELFDRTTILVPVYGALAPRGTRPLAGRNLFVKPLPALPSAGIGRRLLFAFWLLRTAPILLRELLASDAVHVPIPGDIGTVGMLLAFAIRRPLFVRYCGNWYRQRTTAEKFWHWFMERFAGGRNVFMATGGAKHSPSQRNPNIQWIYSTALTAAEISACANARYPGPSDEFRIITVGRQERGKNTSVILESLPTVHQQFPQVSVDVVGDGSELGSLRMLTQEMKLTDYVHFHGYVDHNTVLKLLQGADIFCFPTESEGFPKVVVEAMACGLPVIASAVSVLPQLVPECGILLENTTASAVADAVIAICKNDDMYRLMSMQAVALARNYTLEAWQELLGARLSEQWGRLRNNA